MCVCWCGMQRGSHMGCLAGKKKATSKTRKVAYVFMVSHHSVFIKAMHSGGLGMPPFHKKFSGKHNIFH